MLLDRAFYAVGVVSALRRCGLPFVIPMVFACAQAWGRLSWVAVMYGRRFGIESSYRQLGACLAVTSSRDAVYRLLLVGVSVLLREWGLLGAAPTVHALRFDLILALG